MNQLPEDVKAAFDRRREEDRTGDLEIWATAEAWLARSYSLIKPGGVVSTIMPDGKVFVARKPREEEPKHGTRPDDLPEPGDRCKECGEEITWVGPGPNDWEHVEELAHE